jgi:tetratricopeptide (TPR) repeat protein
LPKTAAQRLRALEALALQGKKSEALEGLLALQREYPRSAAVALGLGHTYALQGQAQHSAKAFEQAYTLNPRYQQALLFAAQNYAQANAWEEASRTYTLYLQYHPKTEAVWKNLALVREALKDPQGALKAYWTAYYLNPAQFKPHDALQMGQLLAYFKKSQEAQYFFKQALGHPDTQPEALASLARLAQQDQNPSAAASYFAQLQQQDPMAASHYPDLAPLLTHPDTIPPAPSVQASPEKLPQAEAVASAAVTAQEPTPQGALASYMAEPPHTEPAPKVAALPWPDQLEPSGQDLSELLQTSEATSEANWLNVHLMAQEEQAATGTLAQAGTAPTTQADSEPPAPPSHTQSADTELAPPASSQWPSIEGEEPYVQPQDDSLEPYLRAWAQAPKATLPAQSPAETAAAAPDSTTHGSDIPQAATTPDPSDLAPAPLGLNTPEATEPALLPTPPKDDLQNDPWQSLLQASTPDPTEGKTAEALFEQAKALQLRGQLDEALQAYWQTVSIEPGRADAWNLMAECYFAQQRYDQAELAALEAIRHDASCLPYTMSYLKVIQRAHPLERLIQELHKARVRFPQVPEITLALARAYERTPNQAQSAASWYTEFLQQAGPKHPKRQEAKAALDRLL